MKMKIKNKRKIVIIVLLAVVLILCICDYYVIKTKDVKKNLLNVKSVGNKTKKTYKNFGYVDIFNAINKCSPKFALIKIDKSNANTNSINVEVEYKGEIQELMRGLETMKTQEIVKNINEISIIKTDNNECTSKINVDFLKFK